MSQHRAKSLRREGGVGLGWGGMDLQWGAKPGSQLVLGFFCTSLGGSLKSPLPEQKSSLAAPQWAGWASQLPLEMLCEEGV